MGTCQSSCSKEGTSVKITENIDNLNIINFPNGIIILNKFTSIYGKSELNKLNNIVCTTLSNINIINNNTIQRRNVDIHVNDGIEIRFTIDENKDYIFNLDIDSSSNLLENFLYYTFTPLKNMNITKTIRANNKDYLNYIYYNPGVSEILFTISIDNKSLGNIICNSLQVIPVQCISDINEINTINSPNGNIDLYLFQSIFTHKETVNSSGIPNILFDDNIITISKINNKTNNDEDNDGLRVILTIDKTKNYLFCFDVDSSIPISLSNSLYFYFTPTINSEIQFTPINSGINNIIEYEFINPGVSELEFNILINEKNTGEINVNDLTIQET